jgi:hypothetical protein
MISFTFSAEQVKSAPPEVRQWIENEVAASFVALTRAHSEPPPGHSAELASCTLEEAARVLELIRDDIATTHVFLELARETPAGNNVPPLRALNIADILRHTRINGGRLVDCLSAISQAFQQIRNDPEAALFGLDQSHLYLHEATHRSIRALWQQLVQMQAPSRTAATAPTALPGIGFMPPYVTSPQNPPVPEVAIPARAPLTGSVPLPAATSAPAAASPIPTSLPVPPSRPVVAESPVPAGDKAPEKASPTPGSTASAQPTPAAAVASAPAPMGPPEIKASAPTSPPPPTHSTPSGRGETPSAQPAAPGPDGPDRRRRAGHRAAAARKPGPTVPNAGPTRRAAGAAASNKQKPR